MVRSKRTLSFYHVRPDMRAEKRGHAYHLVFGQKRENLLLIIGGGHRPLFVGHKGKLECSTYSVSADWVE